MRKEEKQVTDRSVVAHTLEGGGAISPGTKVGVDIGRPMLYLAITEGAKGPGRTSQLEFFDE